MEGIHACRTENGPLNLDYDCPVQKKEKEKKGRKINMTQHGFVAGDGSELIPAML